MADEKYKKDYGFTDLGDEANMKSKIASVKKSLEESRKIFSITARDRKLRAIEKIENAEARAYKRLGGYKAAPRGAYAPPRRRPIKPYIPQKFERLAFDKTRELIDGTIEKTGEINTITIEHKFSPRFDSIYSLVEPTKPKKPKRRYSREKYEKTMAERMHKYKLSLIRHKLALAMFKKGVGPLWEKYYKQEADFEYRMDMYKERRRKQFEKEVNRINRKMQRAAAIYAKHEKRRADSGRITVTAYAGLSPWDPKYGEFKALSGDGYKEYHDRIKNAKKKTIHLSDGTTAEVYDTELGVPLGFSQMFGYHGPSNETFQLDEGGYTPYSSDYIDYAFDKNGRSNKKASAEGHISALEYNEETQLLKVDFASGNTCIYFRVPSVVAAELLHFAETGQTMISPATGKQRHVLGIRFWDLIRIRGARHGSRYRFEYGSHDYESHGTLGRIGKFDTDSATNILTKIYQEKNKKELGQNVYESKFGVTLSEDNSGATTRTGNIDAIESREVGDTGFVTGAAEKLTPEQLENWMYNGRLANAMNAASKIKNAKKRTQAYQLLSELQEDFDEGRDTSASSKIHFINNSLLKNLSRDMDYRG